MWDESSLPRSRPSGLMSRSKATKALGLVALLLLLGHFYLSAELSSTFRKGSRISKTDPSWHGWSGVTRLFIFGDSYTSTNFDVLGKPPSPEHPLGNPPMREIEENWPVHLTLQHNASLIQTYNLASWAAVVDRRIADAPNDFTDQVENRFLPNYKHRRMTGGWTKDNSLFVVWFGLNDVNIPMDHNFTGPTFDEHIGRVLGAYVANMNLLFGAGARNFLILNDPPMNRSPVGRSSDSYYPTAVATYNTALSKTISAFAKVNPEATMLKFDAHRFFTMLFDNPKAFRQTANLRNTTDVCTGYAGHSETKDAFRPECGLPYEQYLWHDGFHPTFHVHEALADQIGETLKTFPAADGGPKLLRRPGARTTETVRARGSRGK